MQLEKASRKRAKIKMALQGPSGSGKTMSALLIAFGLCNSWNKVVVVDTENHSAELYSHLGEYNVVHLSAPFTPEKYIEAISLCEKSKMEVIILDSVSHEWEGTGGILDVHSNMTGNSYTNWSKLTPRHNAFVQAILQSPAHVVGTIRSKQDYVLSERNGKMVPEKVGLKGVTREGMDYEFTIVIDIDIKHNANASKDRTNLFMGKPEFRISTETGKAILQWCESGQAFDGTTPNASPIVTWLTERINASTSIKDLLEVYKAQVPSVQQEYFQAFTQRRAYLEAQPKTISSLPKPSENGTHANASAGK
jgi:hypothetical protein